MKMSLTLTVLAAGMGSRYGGLKQIDPVGPSGETILDYTVFDALRAGFDRVLFIIRKDFEEAFRAGVGARFAGRITVDYAFQALTDLPDGAALPAERVKPWGTGHAVWCAREQLRQGPFAVLNADDFYGRESLQALADFFRAGGAEAPGAAASPAAKPEFAMVGFRMANTLSEHGSVARGVCTVDGDGCLRQIRECTGIRGEDVGAGRLYSPDAIVSMNCWGFTPAFLPLLDTQWRAFVAADRTTPGAEFYLPAAVDRLIASDTARVRVLPTTSSWLGVTYRDDKPRMQAALSALVQTGAYPPALWTAR